MSARPVGILLVAAFVVFLTGAAFWLIGEFERPIEVRLRAVSNRSFRWMWIHAWMLLGTLTSAVAVGALGRLLRQHGGGWLAAAGPLVFAVGCIAFLGALVIGLTATPSAAADLVRTGGIPPGYLLWHRLGAGLYVAHMLLSYATFALLGGALLRGTLAPGWLGWVGLVFGCLGVLGFAVLRGGPFAPPIMAHSFGLLVGIVLFLRSH